MTTQGELKAEYTISENDYVQASRLYSGFTNKQVAISVIVIIILLAVAYIADGSIFRGAAIGGLVGCVGGYMITRFVLAPWRTKRLYRDYAAIREPCTITLENQGIRFRSKNGESLIEWAHILKWRDNDKFVLIYQASHLYHLVPKRLGVVAEKLTETLAKNVGAKS